MKINNNIIRLFSYMGVFLLLTLLSGCFEDQLIDEGGNGNGKTVKLKFELSVPGAPLAMTRSMSHDDEKAIKNFQVLVFEETASGEVFKYKAPFTKKSDLEITVEAKVSQNNEKYRFVILTNVDDAINPTEGKTKEDVLNQYLFHCKGKWGSEATPMWGEYNETFAVKKEKYLAILLHRALARVDVGLRFKDQTQDNQTEEVEGLDNFKINSIRVYRTKNQAYAATSADRMNGEKVITPHIPGTAKYNSDDGQKEYDNLKDADQDPLVYKVNSSSTSKGVDSFVREIYIPESIESVDGKNMDEVPCLVIGGFYNDSDTETFYRADFATYKDGKTVEKYLPVLRNNRYVINIRSVKNSGFKEPDQALNSINTSMILDVQAWNEKPLNFYIQGDYFFQLDNRKVMLEARAGEEAYIRLKVPFTTNLDLTKTSVKFKWESTGKDFENVTIQDDGAGESIAALPNTNVFGENGGAKIRCHSNVITFGASPNVGEGTPAVERGDTLHLQIENFEFSIEVKQKAANLEYELLCETVKVTGKYREGIPLNYTNTITLEIKATLPINKGEEIEVYTETRKGIHFRYKEKAAETIPDGGTLAVTLQGEGTPTRDPNDGNLSDPADPKDGVMRPIEELQIFCNSIDEAAKCATRVFFGYQTKRILTIGANAIYRYGYVLEPNTASRSFVDASVNFGTDPNSTVTMEQFPDDYPGDNPDGLVSGAYPLALDFNSAKNNAFHVEYMSLTNGRMNGEWIKNDVLKALLENFKPHIILTGQAIFYEDDDIALIKDFVDKGGVFLMFNEYYPSVPRTNAMVQALLTTKGVGTNHTQASYDYIDYKMLKPETTEKKDPILEGPFFEGSLAGKHWGSDGICLHGFKGLDPNEVYIYTKRDYDDKESVCFFRHKTKPFLFIGDGGFISNAQRYIGPRFMGSLVYCPFAIDEAYRAIPRTNYRARQDITVYNSQIFGNILTWAVDWAESDKGIKYK